MRLDHISYACTAAELGDVVQRLGSELGAAFADGGRHPQFGTRNFVLPLEGGSYIEVVSALDHPSADKSPFRQAVSRRTDEGGGWIGWVMAVDDIGPVEQRLGRPAAQAHRIRPDGVRLTWRQIGVLDLIKDPQLPFFVQWDTPASDHPSRGACQVGIERIEVCGSPETLVDWLQAPIDHLLEDIEVSWVEAEDPGIVAVWFRSANGLVRID